MVVIAIGNYERRTESKGGGPKFAWTLFYDNDADVSSGNTSILHLMALHRIIYGYHCCPRRFKIMGLDRKIAIKWFRILLITLCREKFSVNEFACPK
jgi:hypothetical protein